MKRWQELKDQKSKRLAKSRAMVASKENIERFCSGLLKCLKDSDLGKRSYLAFDIVV